jgi:hypothetical protein
MLARRRGIYPILGDRVRDKLLYTMFLFVIWHVLFVEKKIMSKAGVPMLKDLFS